MNIDVREYLRINPISVHDLTLSENGDDCFLFFHKHENENNEEHHEYYAKTQTQLFHSLYKSIFGDLICVEDDGSVRLNYKSLEPEITWDDGLHLIDSQFSNYIRRNRYANLTNDLTAKLNQLKQEIERRISTLKSNGVLNYAGAVELMSELNQIYSNFNYANGEIWCHKFGSTNPQGLDRVRMSDTLKHTHDQTRAETLTHPLTIDTCGGQKIGNFTDGARYMVASGQNGVGEKTVLDIMDIEPLSTDKLTYPLQGLNSIDWRNPDRTHNNIPPSYNVYVRYCAASARDIIYSSRSELIQVNDFIDDMMKIYDDIGYSSAVMSKYESGFVDELDVYKKEYLTKHDYILRITNASTNFNLNKQTINMLVESFADITNSELSPRLNGKIIPMADVLKVKLDKELVQSNEFQIWNALVKTTIDQIVNLISTLADLINSGVKPVTYKGRIIISTTDDTEQKVIANYGGKEWIRLVNFIRGIQPSDPIAGTKNGEEYVELRESSIPNHRHDVQLDSSSLGKWFVKDRPGESTTMIESYQASDNGDFEIDEPLNIDQIEYQISPLNYGSKNKLVIPHDNLPPHREVYIWRCVRGDDDDQTEYPQPSSKWSKTISYDMMGHGSIPSNAIRTYNQNTVLPYTPPTPSNVNGYKFLEWKPKRIDESKDPDDVLFTAQWEPIQYRINWKMNGHGSIPWNAPKTYTIETGTYVPDAPRENGWTFLGWSPASIPQGSTGDKTFNANWRQNTYTVTFKMDQSSEPLMQPYTVKWGDVVDSIPSQTPEEYGKLFEGWWTSLDGGNKLVVNKTKVYGDITFYPHWSNTIAKITWDSNGGIWDDGSEQKETIVFLYEEIGQNVIPEPPERPGYRFSGWYTKYEEEVNSDTVVDQDCTFKAYWIAETYTIRFFDLVNNEYVPYGNEQTLRYHEQIVIPEDPAAIEGMNMVGWYTEQNGYGEQLTKSYLVEHDQDFYSWWRDGVYIVTFIHVDGTEQFIEYKYKEPLSAHIPNVDAPNGYENLVWYDENDVELDAEHLVTSNMIFTAKCDIINYTITYNTNDHGVLPNVLTSYNITTRYVFPILEEPGYRFDGWFVQENGEWKQMTKIEYGTTGDIYINAQWEQEEYTITFDSNGGSIVPSISGKHYGDKLGELPVSSKTDFIFAGWFTEIEGGQFVTSTTEITGNATYYAHWVIDSETQVEFRDNIPVTVTFDDNID